MIQITQEQIQVPYDEQPTTDNPNDSVHPEPAFWAIIFIAIFIIAFDTWALIKHKTKISQWFQKHSRARKLFRWIAFSIIAILTYHILWGFWWNIK